MSSPYTVLANRPIDQWKVTELKEELKRRKLPLRGLKDDLIKRLDEALRLERETAKEDSDNGIPSDPDPDDEAVTGAVSIVETFNSMGGEGAFETKDTTVVQNMDHGESIDETMDKNVVQACVDDNVAASQQEKGLDGEVIGDPDSLRVVEELVVHTASMETISNVSEGLVSEVLSVQESHDMEIQNEKSEVGLGLHESQDTEIHNEKYEVGLGLHESHDTEIQKENEPSHAQLENEDSKAQLESEDLEQQIVTEDSKPLHEDAMLKSSMPNYQVPEVTPILGIHVKSDSISTDSVSINEKSELKDDIIADNVKLELDNIKSEMAQPPSSNVAQDDGDIHSMDVQEPKENMVSIEDSHENKVSIEELDEINVIAEASKKNDSAEVVYSEKLNLDRSSGDDSMEEDALDGKQIDSKYNSDEVGEGNEKPNVTIGKEEGFVDVVGNYSSSGEKVCLDTKQSPAPSTVKRKLQDQETGGNNEFSKRQRKWNCEILTVPEPKISNLTPSTTPKDTFQSKMLSCSFSRSDSAVSDDTPKERVVPPSPKSPTNSLRIDRFLRPFTLKALQELLAKTGSVTNFWMDPIKTHCYVTFSSIDEAVETRNAVYNLQWPPNGGRLLVSDFVNPQEVQMRVEADKTTAAPVNAGPTIGVAMPMPPHQPQPSPRNLVPRQLPPPSPSLPPPPLALRELPLPPPPPLPEKPDPPIVTLDDLFKKTKATPRIYYLPLSEEQVARKQAALGQRTKQ